MPLCTAVIVMEWWLHKINIKGNELLQKIKAERIWKMYVLHGWILSNLKTGELGGHHYVLFGDSYVWADFIIFLISFIARSRACSLKTGHEVLQHVIRHEPQVGVSCGNEVINCTSFITSICNGWALVLSSVAYRNGVSGTFLNIFARLFP